MNFFKLKFQPKMIKKVLFAVALTAAFNTAKAQSPTIPADVNALLQKHTCYTCHAAGKKLVGPAWQDVAKKKYSAKQFAALVAKPNPADWPGYPPMAPLPQVPKGDLAKIHAWVSSLAK
jgi:cytochrome c